MAQVQLSERILQRLTSRAQAENKNIEELIETLLDQSTPEVKIEEALQTNDDNYVYDESTDPLALLAKLADELDLRSDRDDVAENSRDLISKAIADHHRERDADTDTDR